MLAHPFLFMTGIAEARRASHRRATAQQRLRDFWSSSPVGLVATDLDQRIVDCNPAFTKMIGRPTADVVGQFGWTFLHADSPAPHPDAVGELLSGSRPGWSVERLLRRADGSPLAVKLDWSVVRDRSGRAVELACVVTDISTQAAAAAQLEAARARAEVLWDRAPVGVIEGTPDGVITAINDAALSMLGHTREALIGTAAAALADPAYTAAISARVAGLLAGHTYNTERHYLHADGHSVAVHVATAVLRDETGKVARLVGFVIDMTDAHAQRQALEDALTKVANAKDELARGHAFTDALLEAVDVGIASCDATGGGLVRNRAQREMLGLSPEASEASDAATVELRGEDDTLLQAWDHPLARVLRGETVHDLDLRQGPAGGRLRDVLVRGHQVRALDGSVMGAVIALTDVTAAREVTRELTAQRARLVEAKRIGRLGSFDYDPVTGSFTASAQLRALWGLPLEGPVEDLARSATHPQDAPRTAVAFAAALAAGGRHTWAFRIHRLGDGALRHLSSTVEVVLGEDGVPVQVHGIHQDVTELVEAEQAAVLANRRFEAILRASPDYTFITDLATGSVVYGTPGKLVLGLTTEQLQQLGAGASATLIHPEDQQRFQERNTAAAGLADGEVVQARYRARHTDGTWRWLNRRVTPFRRDESTGQVVEVLSVIRDVTDVVEAEERLTAAALHDPLTGLPNRALLTDRLDTALARAQHSDRDIAVLFCDLDGFKRVNDTAGHAAGDAVLIETARRLRHAVREHDTLARVGGDEFVIVVEPWTRNDRTDQGRSSVTADRTLATALAERILTALRRPVLVQGAEHAVSASIGITYAGSGRGDTGPASCDEVLQQADAAMYRAKHGGKNRYEVYEP